MTKEASYTRAQLVTMHTAVNNRRYAAEHAYVCDTCGDARPSAESAATCVARGQTPPTDKSYHLRKSTATTARKTWRAGVMSRAYAGQTVRNLIGDEGEEEE